MEKKAIKKNLSKIENLDLSLAVELSWEILNNLFFFTKLILGYDRLTEETHLNLCKFLNDKYLENDTEYKENKLILMPRGSFKSTIASISYVIQQIILNPDIRVLIASESFTNSKEYLGVIKHHFEANELLRALYGNFVSKFGWREDSIVVSTRTKPQKEPTVSCAGVEVTRTGMHYDLIILDDIVTINNIGTKEQIEKVINFYRECTNLIERAGRKGRIIVIGTRWHFSDLYNHILENERENFNIFIRSAYNSDGTLFFPEVLSEEELEKQKRTLGSYLFSANYLNDPVDTEYAVFKKDWIKIYNPNEIGEKFCSIDQMNTYLHIDPAISERKEGDYTGIVVTGVDIFDRIFVLHAERKRLNVFEIIDKIFDYAQKYNVRKVILETQVFQRAIKFFLYDEMRKRRIYLPIHEISHSVAKSKEYRISGLQPRFEFGSIFIRSDMDDLIDELLRFPVGKHDDLIDALSFGLEVWKKPKAMQNQEIKPNTFNWIREKIEIANKAQEYIGNQKLDRWRMISEEFK